MAIAYCLKCSKKVEIRNPKHVTLRNKRQAVVGVCPCCGKRLFRLGTT